MRIIMMIVMILVIVLMVIIVICDCNDVSSFFVVHAFRLSPYLFYLPTYL